MCQKGLFKAIAYFGSQQALAKALYVSQVTISHWLNREQKIPETYVRKLFHITKGSIPLHELTFSHKTILQMDRESKFFSEFPTIPVLIEEIQVKNFVCQKYTDGDSTLINSQDSLLSLPILIDSNHQLIACECRLRANQLLGNHKILVHEVNFRNVIQGDFPLASLIQSFPISEKGIVSLAIERELGNRQGERKDLKLPSKCPEVILGTETREIAAKLVGFKNESLCRRVKVVLKQGISALIHAMDEEKCSVSRAGKIALLHREEQHAELTSFLAQKRRH